jgi:lipopolysaccharide heptosyltransferase II
MFQQISPSQLLDVDARRICLIKPSAMGDIVQTLPLLPVLRERFPQARISWVVNSQWAELIENHPQLDEVIKFDRNLWSGLRRLLAELRSREFDLVFDLQGLLRTSLMTFATRAPLRVGLETAREGANWACNCTLQDTGRQVPAHLRYWRVAEAIGMGERRSDTHIDLGDDERMWARHQLAELRSPVLAIHPGARWRTKRWPVEKFAVAAAKAMRLYGFSAVILGDRRERPTATQLQLLLRRFVPAAPVLDLTGATSLKQLAAVLNEADVLLTNDSGPLHLAAGLGTSIVGIFTCTSPLRSGPPGNQHELVATQLSCAASYKKRCPYRGCKHMACMEELAVERVSQAFVRLMQRKRAAQRVA